MWHQATAALSYKFLWPEGWSSGQRIWKNAELAKNQPEGMKTRKWADATACRSTEAEQWQCTADFARVLLSNLNYTAQYYKSTNNIAFFKNIFLYVQYISPWSLLVWITEREKGRHASLYPSVHDMRPSLFAFLIPKGLLGWLGLFFKWLGVLEKTFRRLGEQQKVKHQISLKYSKTF